MQARGFGLVHAEAFFRAQQLPVELGRLEDVSVRPDDPAHAHAGEHVQHVSAEAAQAHDEYPAFGQPHLFGFAQEAVSLVPFRKHGGLAAVRPERAARREASFRRFPLCFLHVQHEKGSMGFISVKAGAPGKGRSSFLE